MIPLEQGIILGIVIIAGIAIVKGRKSFTDGLFRTAAVLVALGLIVGYWT